MVILFLTIAGTARATLILQAGPYFLDDNTGWYWYSNVTDFTNMDWATAKTSVEALGVGGRAWALASPSDVLTLNAYPPSPRTL